MIIMENGHINFKKTMFFEEMFFTPRKYRQKLINAVIQHDENTLMKLARKFKFKICEDCPERDNEKQISLKGFKEIENT